MVRNIIGPFNRIKRIRTGTLSKAALSTTGTFAAIGPVLFLGGSAAAQVLSPGHDAIRETVSFLVFGRYGWLQTASFYVFGISSLALAVTLLLKVKAKLNPGAIIIALTGLAFILVAINHVQNADTTMTISEIIHRDSAIAIVAMSPLACFSLAHNLKKSGHSGLWIYSIGAGAFAVLTIVVGFLIPQVHTSFLGIFERALLINGQLWAEVISVRLMWDSLKNKPSKGLS